PPHRPLHRLGRRLGLRFAAPRFHGRGTIAVEPVPLARLAAAVAVRADADVVAAHLVHAHAAEPRQGPAAPSARHRAPAAGLPLLLGAVPRLVEGAAAHLALL